MSDSYHNARQGGLSDGTVEGQRGAHDYRVGKRHLQQQEQLWSTAGPKYNQQPADVRHIGNGLMAVIAGLFLHKYFCFVGFWLICFVLLMALPIYFNVPPDALPGLSDWYIYVAASVPMVLAVLLRKIIPTLMRWTFIVAIVAGVGAFVIGIIVHVVQSR